MAVPWAELVQLGIQLQGEGKAARERDKELALLKELMEEYRNVPLPELERVAAEELGPSAMEGIGTDPALRSAQLDALGRLQDLARGGGLTLEDEAALSKVLGKAARQESMGRQRLSDDFAARGQLGSGAQLAMALQGNQASANRGREEAMDRAAMAQRRSLDAMLNSGRLAGEVRGQDYGEKARAAEARDAISRYNASARDRARYYNAGLAQQQFHNRLAKLGGGQGAGNNLAAFYGQSAQDARTAGAGYGKAAYEAGRMYDSHQDTSPRYDWEDDPDYHRRSPSRLGYGEDK